MRYPKVGMEGLTAIVALAETGDVVKAGELLNIGPSGVKKRLSKAEGELLTKLFHKMKEKTNERTKERTKEKLVLNAYGKVYSEEALRAVEHAVLAEEKVNAERSLREKRLLIGRCTHLPSRLLVALTRLNSEDTPGMTVEQTGGVGHELEVAVENSLLHAGIGFFPVSRPHLSTLPLIEEPLTLCVPIGDPLATKAEIRPEDLERQPIIAVGRQALPALHEEIAEFYRGFGLELNVVADAYAASEALCLVEQRMGVCFLSGSAASLSRNIVSKPLSTRVLTRKCGVFFHEHNRHPLIHKFVALLSEKINPKHL